MVNGKHVAGQGLSGATVTIQGRSAVLSLASGAFSFPVTNKSFMVLGVKKQGYQLVDADATRKAYQYSPNTFYVLMETPEQQAEDKLSAERKIRRTLQRQLQQREDELEELKEQNKLTQEEYQKKLQQLYDDQQNNEKLIADMAKEYSQMDYDQMDELNRQISDAILNGELTRADSLLRSKGDIGSRVASLRKAQEAEIQREAEIAKEQEELAASKAGTKKRLEDLAQDCKNYFDRFKMSNQHDSAAYYIELRAGLDTMNVVWQSGAGFYYYEQNQYKKSEIYLDRALAICHRLVQDNPQAYEPYMANTLNNLANLYRDTQRFSEGEEMFKEALAIRSRLAEANPRAYEPDVAMTLNNLAVLYNTTQQTSELESVCKELRQLYTQKTNREYKQGSKESAEKSYKNVVVNNKRLIDLNFESYIYDYIQSLSNYVLLAAANKHFAEAYQTNKSDFLPIYKKLSDNNPERFFGGGDIRRKLELRLSMPSLSSNTLSQSNWHAKASQLIPHSTGLPVTSQRPCSSRANMQRQKASIANTKMN
jgi:hypothetical protein